MPTPTKNVCMIAYTQYPYDNRIRREAETLVAQGNYHVLIMVPKEADTAKTYTLQGVSVVELNMQQYRGKSKLKYIASYMAFTLRAFFMCNKLLFFKQAHIFHIHNMPNFLVFAAIVPRMLGKKVVLDIHDSVPETYATKFDQQDQTLLFRLLCVEEALCCWLAHHIVCVNHPQRDTLVRRGIPAAKITVSLNVPDHKWFSLINGGNLCTSTGQSFKLVYHGTLAKRLGIDIVIEAVGKLASRIPGLEFHIYGVGDDQEEFIQRAAELGLQSCIHFHGRLPLDKLLPILETMDLGVIGNRKNVATELMLPVKMLEYIALNIPVVVPRLSTVQYYFTEEMVSYFEPEDSGSLAAAILALYQSQEKRMQQTHLARTFLERYNWKKHQHDFLALYNQL